MARAFHPPATNRVYDVCVIGSQLGGVVAGALLARRGHRVLHVDHGPPAAEEGGWRWPGAPSLLPALRQLPAAQAALAELGLGAEVQRAQEAAPQDLQVLLPRARLALGRDPQARAAELRREWPEAADRLEGALEELAAAFLASSPFLERLPPLPPSGLVERWALSRALRESGGGALERPLAGVPGHPLWEALLSLSPFLCDQDGPPAPLAVARLLGAAARGGHRLPAGLGGLVESLRRRIADSRGDLLGGEAASARAESLELEGRRVAALRVAGSADGYGARVFVLAEDAALLDGLLPETERAGKRLRALRRGRPGRRVATLHRVVAPGGLPPGLGEVALALPDRPVGPLLLQTGPARRAGGKGEDGARFLSVSGLAPPAGPDGEADALRGWAAEVGAALSDLLPFLERHVLEAALPAPAGPGPAPRSLLLPDPRGALGVALLPTVSPWPNLLLAGREVLPGLGLEGAFHAGVQAAASAERLLGKRPRPR